jgi:hypothetical protein
LFRRAASYVDRILNGEKPAPARPGAYEVSAYREPENGENTRLHGPGQIAATADEVIE